MITGVFGISFPIPSPSVKIVMTAAGIEFNIKQGCFRGIKPITFVLMTQNVFIDINGWISIPETGMYIQRNHL